MIYRIVMVGDSRLIVEPAETTDEIAVANKGKVVSEVALEGTWDNCPRGATFVKYTKPIAKPKSEVKKKVEPKPKPVAEIAPEPEQPPVRGLGNRVR